MIETDRCPLGYFCETMVGCSVSECPNLDTCLTLRPYCALEFPTYEAAEINPSNGISVQQEGQIDLSNPYNRNVKNSCYCHAGEILVQLADWLEVE